ncbi:hypothetical protein EJF18_10658 [Clavispora lusitaniae]|uniref:Uncharacterized protein n=1 Tax=Clavispora lusitaniae TaxID=36911 RepID=A0ACD0WDE7_CLALS|nr:hypothetical protein EJF14_10658 [Clavispora lusitaniae]QFZ31138.1 hypothetical protein EJF16_10658 [Clavispora lusitaniae]QFZ36806.1 hypothetical protein EJF15_10658 [Clavispora lusitaniae]QFZ42490.1 hypothetical protein EJF18_10658 [Clavispora lusitaniae]QFZ48166.1 hypothetical protein EJF17_10658 [Clavispora lusitaniae]
MLWLLALALLGYIKYLDLTRDVPPEYLEQQSVVDSTRRPKESAVYKSTKLDYSGLRVGLDLRYESYKLRNGNLCDVWEIALRVLRERPDRRVCVGRETISLAQLNGHVAVLARRLRGASELRIPRELFVADPHVLAVVLACFVVRVTVHVGEKEEEEREEKEREENENEKEGSDQSGCVFFDGRVFSGARNGAVRELLRDARPSDRFENVYAPEKDRGIALRVSAPRARGAVSTAFTQGNLVAAVASCIKHLPPAQMLGANDRVAIVQDTTSVESTVNGLVKALAALVSQSELFLAQATSDCWDWRPTVLSMSAPKARALLQEAAPASLAQKLGALHRRVSLSRLRLAHAGPRPHPSVRLLYVHHSVDTAQYFDTRAACQALGTRVVQEWGYFVAAGPLVVSDVFDVRKRPDLRVRGFGAVAQSDELKLVHYDGASPGTLCARGYNMGKAKQFLERVGENTLAPDEEGFYTLPVQARWGSDGCLYIMG